MEIEKTYIVMYNGNLVKLHQTRHGNYYLEFENRLTSITVKLAKELLLE